VEAGKRVYDVRAGDVIFHTRWLFHRTVAFDRGVVRENRRMVQKELVKRRERRRQPGDNGGEDDDDWAFLLEGEVRPLLYRRYSVRYAPGSAQLPRGFGTELSTLYNPDNQGRTLDAVDKHDGPWYPQCWPFQPNATYIQEMHTLVETKLPTAEARRREMTKQMAPYLQKIARQNRAPSKKRSGGAAGARRKTT